MKIPINATPEQVEAVVEEQIVRIIGSLERPAPRLLHHYTDSAGFFGIVEKKQLWATHRSFMNDHTEGEHAYRMLTDACVGDAARVERVLGFRNEDFTQRHDYYVACFSESDDSLGQWRAYAGDGQGYALGIDVTEMRESGLLAAVVYDAAKQRGFIADALALLHGADGLDAKRQQIVHVGVRRVMSIFSLVFKHHAYADEREWRIVWIADPLKTRLLPQTAFSVSRYGVTPYLPCPLTLGKVERVGLGPRNRLPGPDARHGDPSLAACRKFLDAHDCSAQVYGSAVPYR
jgi:Protein of unknown function (DUF2971)